MSKKKVCLLVVAVLVFLLAATVNSDWAQRHSAKLQEARLRNAQSPSVAGKQALIFGGTSGIGKALALRLAAGGASVTIAGRNAVEGAKVVATMNENSSTASSLVGNRNGTSSRIPVHSFLQVDASLMANNKVAAAEFLNTLRLRDDKLKAVEEEEEEEEDEAPLPGGEEGDVSVDGHTPRFTAMRLDYLIFCQTKATLQGRTPTKEGIDEKLALNYYSRVFLTRLLAPLMEETARKSSEADPRVMSVLSAGAHKPYPHFKEDPYLIDHYSQGAAADITSFYSDLWADKASRMWPSVTFVHVAPGLVKTNWGTDMPLLVRWIIRLLQLTPLSKSAADCAELLLPGLISPDLKSGGSSSSNDNVGDGSPNFKLLGEYSQAVPKTELHTEAAVEQVFRDTTALLQKAEESVMKTK